MYIKTAGRPNLQPYTIVQKSGIMPSNVGSSQNPMKTVLAIPLKPELLHLDEDELAFYKKKTGIEDTEELKQNIIKIQEEAYEVFPYPCIHCFAFTKLQISHLDAYTKAIQLGQERPGALFLDLGCCFGNDVRKAVSDGFPANQALASDLHEEFWQLGYKLFCDSPETFPVPFIQGDIFDDTFLQVNNSRNIHDNAMEGLNNNINIPDSNSPRLVPDISNLKSLNSLHGHISIIHASQFFHLFNEDQQTLLAHKLASLLSPEPGSIIFGVHGGQPVKGTFQFFRQRGHEGGMFCHSPESWIEL
ncbi:hypothetical protein ABKN59_003241 [Abortiporus biennis]